MPFVKGPLPQRLKLAHGFGAVAFGVKDSGFSFFLLPFYNLVLGVDASTVGAALATALLIDALVDPLLGHLSDRTYTKWGRRLPWLYLAPIPLAVLWTLLWSPPFTGAPGYWDIVALAVGVRLLLSACEVPSVSLVPEITDDYDERTTLFRYRFLSGWLGGLLMMVLTFTLFLPTPQSQLQPEGYASYGLFGAALMVLAVFAGLSMFGFWGIVLGPVLMIVIVTTVSVYLVVYRGAPAESITGTQADAGDDEARSVPWWRRMLPGKPRTPGEPQPERESEPPPEPDPRAATSTEK